MLILIGSFVFCSSISVDAQDPITRKILEQEEYSKLMGHLRFAREILDYASLSHIDRGRPVDPIKVTLKMPSSSSFIEDIRYYLSEDYDRYWDVNETPQASLNRLVDLMEEADQIIASCNASDVPSEFFTVYHPCRREVLDWASATHTTRSHVRYDVVENTEISLSEDMQRLVEIVRGKDILIRNMMKAMYPITLHSGSEALERLVDERLSSYTH